MGAKATRFMGQTSCRIGMSMCGICAMEINVMEYFKPGE